MHVTPHLIIVDEKRENLGRFYYSKDCLTNMFAASIRPKRGVYNIETDTSKLSKNMIIKTLLLINKKTFHLRF
jgi:hypothetical protein